MLITLILWWIFCLGWGIGELGVFLVPFCILLVYALGASYSFFVYILLFTDKKKEEKKAFLSGCKIEGRVERAWSSLICCI